MAIIASGNDPVSLTEAKEDLQGFVKTNVRWG